MEIFSVYALSTLRQFSSFFEVVSSIDKYWLYMLLVTGIIAFIAQTFAMAVIHINKFKFSKKMLSGWEAAKATLTLNCVYGTKVSRVGGSMTDYYDVSKDEIYLSDTVYENSSVTAISVACHEAGHAVEKAFGSPMIKISAQLNFGCDVAVILFFCVALIALPLGIYILEYYLLKIGIIVFSTSLIFKLVTLPVEIQASKRAMDAMKRGNMLTKEELRAAFWVLFASGLTYVSSVFKLLFMLIQFAAISNRKK